ncbi:hypothetical protein D9M68_867680 [compost metagenome]
MAAQFGHQRRQVCGPGSLAQAIRLEFRAQQVQMADLRFRIESGLEALALDVRDQAAQFQQAQRFSDRTAAGAETLLQFLFP